MQTVRLLLADRKRHVREFLKRELEKEGYAVALASTAQEILTYLASGERPDLLILDLEVPFVFEADLLTQLHTFYPTLPILIHSFPPDNPQVLTTCQPAAFIEKNEDPRHLKAQIMAMLQQAPAR